MATTTSSLILLSFFLLASSARCFNITRILGTYPDFSQFNSYLTQTQVTQQINSRQTITVLAVANSAMSGVSGSSDDLIKKIVSLHVILDYYDPTKLQNLSNKTALLTTLFQSSGLANGKQGFLNVTDTENGVRFGSAVPGSSLDIQLVKSVVAQPYNISVLQVSGPIIPGGLNDKASPPPPPANAPKQSPPPADSPKKSPPAKAPAPSSKAPSPKAAPPKSAKAPAPSHKKSPPPAEAPEADAPTADAPDADAPDADAPAADKPAADAPATTKSSATRMGYGVFVALVMSGFSSWVGL